MKIVKSLFSSIIAVMIMYVFVFAEGNIKKGKELFNNPKFGGGTANKSCNSCHTNGNGLEGFIEKKEVILMGKKLKNHEEAINNCIKNPMIGNGIDPNGPEMADIIAYIKSLKKPAEKSKKSMEKHEEKIKLGQ